MKNLFNILETENYDGQPLFNSIEELKKFADEHFEELEDLKRFDLQFDTDEWTMGIGAFRLSLSTVINEFEKGICSYFDDVKKEHGSASIVYDHNGECLALYSESY